MEMKHVVIGNLLIILYKLKTLNNCFNKCNKVKRVKRERGKINFKIKLQSKTN